MPCKVICTREPSNIVGPRNPHTDMSFSCNCSGDSPLVISTSTSVRTRRVLIDICAFPSCTLYGCKPLISRGREVSKAFLCTNFSSKKSKRKTNYLFRCLPGIIAGPLRDCPKIFPNFFFGICFMSFPFSPRKGPHKHLYWPPPVPPDKVPKLLFYWRFFPPQGSGLYQRNSTGCISNLPERPGQNDRLPWFQRNKLTFSPPLRIQSPDSRSLSLGFFLLSSTSLDL